MDNDTKYLAYLLLQHTYLEKMGCKDKSEDEILKEHFKYFPDNWSLINLDKKIEYITKAINEHQNLRELDISEMNIIKY